MIRWARRPIPNRQGLANEPKQSELNEPKVQGRKTIKAAAQKRQITEAALCLAVGAGEEHKVPGTQRIASITHA